MNVRLNSLENSRVELVIKVDKEEFIDALQKAFKRNVSKYNVPGFRKGKVPFNIFKKMFGSEILYNDAANFVIDKTYREAVNDNNIEVVDYPEIDVTKCVEGEDFEYTAVVYVKPEVKLGQYKGIEIKDVKYDVADEDIDNELKAIQNKNSRLLSKEDGVVEDGNVAIIDFKGYVDGKAFEGGESKDYSLTIGSKTFIDNFEEQLIGKSKGDDVEVSVKFPEDYNAEELKGKDAKFEVKIKDVKINELPDLDDEFAKSFSEFDTLDDLKSDIRSKLEEKNENKRKYELENQIIEKVCENAEVYIPEPMVESEIDKFIQDFEVKIKYQGITLENYCKHYGISLEDIRNNFRDRASKQVLSNLVLEKISQSENIQVNDKEIDDKALELAKMYSQDEERIVKIKDNLLKTHRKSLEQDMILSKTIEFLLNESKKTLE